MWLALGQVFFGCHSPHARYSHPSLPSKVQVPFSRQYFERLHSASLVATQLPPRAVHPPMSRHQADIRQSASVRAVQSPSIAEHAPESRQPEDRVQSARLTAKQPPLSPIV